MAEPDGPISSHDRPNKEPNNDLSQEGLSERDWPEIIRKVRTRTPARLIVGRAGAAYRTSTQIDLREAHAAARDAVCQELNLERDFDASFHNRWSLFEVCTQAEDKEQYLLRPDLGRHFSEQTRAQISQHGSTGNDLQIVVGDGLSVAAVRSQVPPLLRCLDEGARVRHWSLGQVCVIRHCRVGILNEIGELLLPRVAVLLIGERPGLATAESLSAYMAYQPGRTHTDANRNLISNIHPRGVSTEQAAGRILRLAAQMMAASMSGCELREELPAQIR
jgi:ethanolamine ammonia-lyase small subunit